MPFAPSASAGQSNMPSRRVWWALILLACVLRVAHAPLVSTHHADELWQYLEPAYRLTSGDWVRTWEWREGTRSWLIPAMLAGPMALGKLIGAHVLLPRLLMIAFSLLAVAGAIRLGARFSRRHAIMAGFVAATWFEFVYFAPRTLSEPLGCALFIGAAALLLDGREHTPARLALAGLMLGAVVMVRFQFGPAVLVLAGTALFRTPRAALPLIAGGVAACAIAGLIDLCAGEIPFRWIWASLHQNLVVNRSANYGVSGPFGYVDELAGVWSWAALVLVPLGIFGARRYPVLMAVAVVNLLLHSLIPHKEYRFVLLSTMIVVLLAALASVDLAERFRRPGRVIWGLAAGWLLLSVVTAAVLPFKRHWGGHGALPRALIAAGQVEGQCGLAVVGRTDRNTVVTAFTFHNRASPMIMFPGPDGLAVAGAHTQSFNVMIAPYLSKPPADFHFRGCSETVTKGRPNPPYCIWARPGPCTAPPAEYNPSTVMQRLGI